MNMYPIILVGLSVIVTLVLTIVLAIAVVPDKKRDKLKGFARALNDIFNFRGLLIESIVRFLYLLSTVACVVTGFFMSFLVIKAPSFFGDTEYVTRWYGWAGILLMILGPILIRLVFEAAMLFILLVKNTIQINNKLRDPESEVKAPVVPVAQNTNAVPKSEVAPVPAKEPVKQEETPKTQE